MQKPVREPIRKANPKLISKLSSQTPLNTSPKTSPRASLGIIPKTTPKTITKAIPKMGPKTSPKLTPKTSPKPAGSPQKSPPRPAVERIVRLSAEGSSLRKKFATYGSKGPGASRGLRKAEGSTPRGSVLTGRCEKPCQPNKHGFSESLIKKATSQISG